MPASRPSVQTQPPRASEGVTLTPRDKLGNPRGGFPVHAIYAYSGLVDREDGVVIMLRKRGATARGYDFKSGQNLLDDTVWQQIGHSLDTSVDTGLFTPPCSSFSPARGNGPGPRILRTIEEPYGIKHPVPPWTPSEAKTLQEGTYHVLKSLEAAARCHDVGSSFLVERPATFREGQVTMALFSEYIALLKRPNVFELTLDQCMFDAASTKPTTFLIFTTAQDIQWSDYALRCTHPRQEHHWTDAWGMARTSYSAHPPIIGQKDQGGKWKTSGAENYPAKLNEALVSLILQFGKARRNSTSSS
jgi:hypothetical protein